MVSSYDDKDSNKIEDESKGKGKGGEDEGGEHKEGGKEDNE